MGTINISNSNNRDAIVNTETVRPPMRVRWLDEKGRQAQNVRLLRCTVDRDCEELVKVAGSLEKVSDLLLKGDPEVDVESYGRYLSDTSRVYIDPDKKIVHKIQEWEIVRNTDGSIRERRPRKVALPNTSTETPLRWSGKLMKKAEVFNKFVFAGKLQIVHVNGLTFDFLFAMAKDLQEKESLMLMGAGQKANQPLIFHRGGVPYRGFLEGRIQGEKYCLILHLSNLELKAPAVVEQPAEPAPASPPSPPVGEGPGVRGSEEKSESKPAKAGKSEKPEKAEKSEPKTEKKKSKGKKA